MFRDYLTTRYGITIPIRGREIVKVAPSMGDPTPVDPFLRWLRQAQDARDAK